MKNNLSALILFPALVIFTFAFKNLSGQQAKEPWTEKQLIQPQELAKIIIDCNKPETYIFSIGPMGFIKNTIDIGEGKDKKNLEKLKKELSKLPKDANIVIYCGCCPFKDCPNIRPAFALLNKMKFTNHKLLNLPKNLKVDWIDKGYPMNN